DDSGRGLYGDAWESVQEEILDHVDLVSVQDQLKAMMSGQPISVELRALTGRVEVTARVAEMHHTSRTKATEFNNGTEVQWSDSDRKTRTDAFQLPISGLFGKHPTGGPIGGGGVGRDTIAGRGESARSGMTNKSKVPGEVFDGQIELVFDLQRGPA